MKAKYLIIVSLMLAIITIGVVSASEDVMADELATGDVTEDPIEEVSVDDVIEESENSESLGDVAPQDFNVQIKDSVNLTDGNDDVAITYTYPQDATGEVQVFIGDNDYPSYYSTSTASGIYNITLDDLDIYESGTYKVQVKYFVSDDDVLSLANGTMNVVETYGPDDFETIWRSDIDSKTDFIFDVWSFPTKGTLIVYVGGQKRFNATIEDLDDDIYVYVADLNITSNGKYTVSAKYVTTDSQEIDLGEESVEVDIDWSYDKYVQVSKSLDILEKYDTLVYLEDYTNDLNGTLTVYIDGSLKLTKKILASEKVDEIYVSVNDLNLYNNAALGKHNVKAVYMKDNVEQHIAERSVEFYAEPSFDSYYTISVGEKETVVINHVKGFTGTATLYNAKWDDDSGEYVKGTVVGSSKFTNGVAIIPFGSLTKGEHDFLLNITGMDQERHIQVEVLENTPGISADVSASEIIYGNNVVVNFKGPQSTQKVYIDLDGDNYKSVVVTTGVLSETIAGLSVGTHKIKVHFEDTGKFYSNTFYVTVKETPAPPAKDTIKLTLKKVKVKKSAKKVNLQATLKINGKAANKKVIKFKFNKNSYKAKTNKKGVAKVIVKGKALKKLKVGKKVKIQASFGKVVKKLTVKVKK